MLLTFFKQVRCGVMHMLYYSLPFHEIGLASLLAMIDQLTFYWPYDVPWDHLPKIKILSCHSLPVDYGTRLLITKGSITHKLLS